jgi:hypothetical protein
LHQGWGTSTVSEEEGIIAGNSGTLVPSGVVSTTPNPGSRCTLTKTADNTENNMIKISTEMAANFHFAARVKVRAPERSARDDKAVVFWRSVIVHPPPRTN